MWCAGVKCKQESSGRESREGLVGSEQREDVTPASTLNADDSAQTTRKQQRHLHHQQQQQQQQHGPAATASHQRLKNPVTCRVLMLDGVEYELNVEVSSARIMLYVTHSPKSTISQACCRLFTGAQLWLKKWGYQIFSPSGGMKWLTPSRSRGHFTQCRSIRRVQVPTFPSHTLRTDVIERVR